MRRRSAPGIALLALAVLALAGGLWPGAAAAQGHPFYEQLLTDGVVALGQGNAPAAARDLRLAAFGLLDQPGRLVVALAHLATAQSAGGDAEGLQETLERLLAVEQRFSVWAAAELPPETRSRVTDLLVERMTEGGLASVPAFRDLAEVKQARRLDALAPAERRREIQALAAADPQNPRWQLELGRGELAAGDFATAASRGSRALEAAESDTTRTEARCLRGRALAGGGSCAAAVADLETCPASRAEADTARALLDCHSQLGQWRQAKELADALPPALRARRDIARLARRAEREAARLPVPAAPPAEGTAEAAAGEPSGEAPAPPAEGTAPATEVVAAPGPAAIAAPPPLPAAAQRRLDEARSAMTRARSARDLDSVLQVAREVADAHPGSLEAQRFTGEVAYRASRWPEAAAYLQRGSEPDEPQLLFYLAVALHETGQAQEAARVLRKALPGIQRTPFVDSYIGRILGTAAP